MSTLELWTQLGDWWCPDCGKWIVAGDGKWAGDFIIHKWCS